MALFLGMWVSDWLGRRLGQSRLGKDPNRQLVGTSVIEGGIFAIWGLLLAFAFSGAATRFDGRRALVAEEANAIGTAYLRLDLLPPAEQEPLRKMFREYLDSRIEVYLNSESPAKREEAFARSNKLQGEIWKKAVAATASMGASAPPMLVIPALNSMIDITTTRYVAALTHPPIIVFVMILVVSMLCGFILGYDQSLGKFRNRLHVFGFIVINTLIFYVILDMEFPRLGLIRVDSIDQVLVQLRDSW